MRRSAFGAVLFVLLALGAACAEDNASPSPPTTGRSSSSSSGGADGGGTGADGGPLGSDGGTPGVPPAEPPAKICDAALLAGPAAAPAGAITVAPTDDLPALVDEKPAGTTFYLAAGTHKLGAGEFDQVVPKDGDVFVGAPGAIIDGQKKNRYAFTQHAKNVVIRYLTVQNFVSPVNEGVVNHDAGEGWTIEYVTVQNNGGAGVFLGSGSVIRYSCLRDNGQYGFSAYAPDGIHDVTLDHDEISGNNTDDLETKTPGCGCTGAGKFWATKNAIVTNNWVHDNKSVGLWADTNNVGFDVEGNWISNNVGPGFFYEISYNARVAHNVFVKNALVDGPKNPGFPTGAIYLSESGGDARVGGAYSTIEITDNVFTDNWSGVVLWENADRFCNSPANTSSDYCTLGGAATLAKCAAGTIEGEPYRSDCRWKTQNVSVHDNTFALTVANVPSCKPEASCGLNAIFSNFGTYPDWSPYKGAVVEDAITTAQNNVFANNRYEGPWSFMAHDQAKLVDLAAWQGAPYNQDKGSTKK